MIDCSPQAFRTEEMNTIEVRYVYSPISKTGRKKFLSHIKVLFTWLKTSTSFPVLTVICKLSLRKWEIVAVWETRLGNGFHVIFTWYMLYISSFHPVCFCISYSMNPIFLPFPAQQKKRLVIVSQSYLWLGGGQSEPYSWTCMPKKHKSTPSISSKAKRALVRYGKDSAISPLSTNLHISDWKKTTNYSGGNYQQ